MRFFPWIMLFVSFSFTACEKLLFQEDLDSKSPQANFEYLWRQCLEKYAYFEVKGIDWEQVRLDYQAQISEDMSEDSLFQVLGRMLSTLRDDHTNLVSDFDVSSYGVVYRGQDNFDWRLIEDHYIGYDYYNTGPFQHDFLANGQVGYIRFSSFTGTMTEAQLDFILGRYQQTKGLILDLRENGGGAVSDVFSLLSRFVDTQTLVYYSRTKNGPKLDDFSEPEPAYVFPSGGTRYTGKIWMLVDRGTYSAGSFTSLATKAIAHIRLMGDTTGGGLGLPNGGQLPNGWTYRFSITQALTLAGSPAYENGVPPDSLVGMDWNTRQQDEILEAALGDILR